MSIECAVSGGQRRAACLHQLSVGAAKLLTKRLQGECAWWGWRGRKMVGKDAGNVIKSELKIREKPDCSAHVRPGGGNDRGRVCWKGKAKVILVLDTFRESRLGKQRIL